MKTVYLFFKSFVKPHSRTLSSGRVVPVKGYVRLSDAEKSKLHDFVSGVLSDKSHNDKSIVLHISSREKREKVLDQVGVDIGSAKEILLASRVIHAHKDHPKMTVGDWDKLPAVMEGFDKVYLGRGEGDPKTQRLIFVRVEKGSGIVYAAELARSKSRGDRLNVLTYFKDTAKSVAYWLSTRV